MRSLCEVMKRHPLFLQQVGIAAHEEDIKAFQRASRATRTPDLKDWVDRTLPTLQAHLKHARDR